MREKEKKRKEKIDSAKSRRRRQSGTVHFLQRATNDFYCYVELRKEHSRRDRMFDVGDFWWLAFQERKDKAALRKPENRLRSTGE